MGFDRPGAGAQGPTMTGRLTGLRRAAAATYRCHPDVVDARAPVPVQS